MNENNPEYADTMTNRNQSAPAATHTKENPL
jgi:hypothetical protein